MVAPEPRALLGDLGGDHPGDLHPALGPAVQEGGHPLTAPREVERYLAGLPEASRAALERLRKAIRAAAPEATERISYRMPAFEENGRILVWYAAFRDHCSIFPASEAVRKEHGEELAPYLSGKGTIRSTADHPIPTALVKRIVKTRRTENETARRR